MQIFVGSSRESIGVARNIATYLESLGDNDIQVLVWDRLGLFVPGEYTLESLEKTAHEVDAALFVFAEDDKTWWRGEEVHSVRDNVLFEYGLFSGVLSRQRVAIVKTGDPKRISDLDGLNFIYHDPRKQNTTQSKLEVWLNNVRTYKTLETNESISVMSFYDALNYGIKSSPCIRTLKVFAISTTFSVKVFRTDPDLKICDAYVILRCYEKNDPYYSEGMEAAIANSVGSWEELKKGQNIEKLHIGYFNYHPDEGFYLIDDKILICGMLNTYRDTNSVDFDRKVFVVKNTSAVGREIIALYQRRFDQLMVNFMNHE